MSKPTTPAERIEEIRRMIPPPEGRKARNPYISKDDLADLLGAGRSSVINWTRGKATPERRYRVRLAELSQGRYTPEDLAPHNPRIRQDHGRLAELEARVAELERLSNAALPLLDQVVARVDALAKQRPSKRDTIARKAR